VTTAVRGQQRIVRSIVMRLLILLMCLSFLAPTATAQQGRSAKKWYEGGMLHKKSALDWQRADAADKLATCGDFIAGMWDRKEFRPDIQKSIKSLDDMKPYAEKLVVFLD